MKDFEIIDCHIHLSPSLEEEVGYYPYPGRRDQDRRAYPEMANAYMDQAGISKMGFMILIPRQFRAPLFEKGKLMALPEAQRGQEMKKVSAEIAALQKKYNEWGCRVGRENPRLIPFITITDDFGDEKAILKELELRVKQGTKGVKLHPGIYSFRPDNEVLFPMYEKCQELGLPVLSDTAPYPHSGQIQVYPLHYQVPKPHIEYGEPVKFEPVLKTFPRLKLIMAHLGSAWWDERVELAQKYPNVYFDTSQGFLASDRIPINAHRGLGEEDAPRIIRKIGVKRVLFGTDWSALAAMPQLEQILRMNLTDREKQAILADNTKRVYNL